MKSVMKDALTKFEKPLTGKGEWPPDSLDEIRRLTSRRGFGVCPGGSANPLSSMAVMWSRS